MSYCQIFLLRLQLGFQGNDEVSIQRMHLCVLEGDMNYREELTLCEVLLVTVVTNWDSPLPQTAGQSAYTLSPCSPEHHLKTNMLYTTYHAK